MLGLLLVDGRSGACLYHKQYCAAFGLRRLLSTVGGEKERGRSVDERKATTVEDEESVLEGASGLRSAHQEATLLASYFSVMYHNLSSWLHPLPSPTAERMPQSVLESIGVHDTGVVIGVCESTQMQGRPTAGLSKRHPALVLSIVLARNIVGMVTVRLLARALMRAYLTSLSPRTLVARAITDEMAAAARVLRDRCATSVLQDIRETVSGIQAPAWIALAVFGDGRGDGNDDHDIPYPIEIPNGRPEQYINVSPQSEGHRGRAFTKMRKPTLFQRFCCHRPVIHASYALETSVRTSGHGMTASTGARQHCRIGTRGTPRFQGTGMHRATSVSLFQSKQHDWQSSGLNVRDMELALASTVTSHPGSLGMYAVVETADGMVRLGEAKQLWLLYSSTRSACLIIPALATTSSDSPINQLHQGRDCNQDDVKGSTSVYSPDSHVAAAWSAVKHRINDLASACIAATSLGLK